MGFDFENYIAELISDKYGINLEPYLTPEGQYELGENSLGIEIKNDTLINMAIFILNIKRNLNHQIGDM